MTLAGVRVSAAGLLAASWLGAVSPAFAQPVSYRLPAKDPNTNSDVVRSAAFSPDGLRLVVGYGRFTGLFQESRPGQAVSWDARTGTLEDSYPAKVDGVCSVGFTPDGKALAVAEYTGSIGLWDVATGRERLRIAAPAIVRAIAISPDGNSLAAGLDAGAGDVSKPPSARLVVWDLATGKLTKHLPGHTQAVVALAFSPDGRLLVSGSMDGSARVWDLAAGTPRFRQDFPGLRARADPRSPIFVNAVAFSPDGRTYVATASATPIPFKPGGEGEATFRRTVDDREVATLRWAVGEVEKVAFRGDGALLATAGEDGVIRLWDPDTGRRVGSMKGGGPITFSLDGRGLISTLADGTLASRDVADALKP